jgi:hypothetical protein
MSLFLRVDPDGIVRGLLAGAGAGRLIPVIGTVDVNKGTITLGHSAARGIGAGTLIGRCEGTADRPAFTGTAVRDGIEIPWAAAADLLAGEWMGQGALPRFRILHPSSDLSAWTGAWISDDEPSRWSPLAVTVNGPDIVLEADGRRASVTRTGRTLAGQLTMDQQTVLWAANRLDDGLTR